VWRLDGSGVSPDIVVFLKELKKHFQKFYITNKTANSQFEVDELEEALHNF